MVVVVVARGHADNAGRIDGYALVQGAWTVFSSILARTWAAGASCMASPWRSLRAFSSSSAAAVAWAGLSSVLVSSTAAAGLITPVGADRVMASRSAESFKAQTSVELQSAGVKWVQLQGGVSKFQCQRYQTVL